ncbi:MAG: outer membrane protein assembly factor BamA [Phycisphaerae bacterium]|nr:outer membrane protein assembly factor BamA [Phycisphaerae bacterium]
MADSATTLGGFTRSQRGLIVIGCILAFWSTMGLLQVGPQPVDPVGRAIDRVEFEGTSTLDPIYLQSVSGIKPGEVWNRDAIAEACRKLAATQKFEGTPFAEPREIDGKLVLVFVVQERPYITGIDFVGNEKFKAGALLKELQLDVGSPASEFLIREAQQTIEKKYRDAGYAYATVEIDREVLRAERRVLFRISEGPRVKVQDIEFEGNLSYSNIRLRSLIETQTSLWIFRTGAFDAETAERDAAAIKAFYIARGYLNAQVGYRIDFRKGSESDLIVTFLVNEGVKHYIASLKFVGNTIFDDTRLVSGMKCFVGEVIDSDILKLDRERIIESYGRLGYIYAEVNTSYVFAEEDGFVHLTVTIAEQSQYRFGRLVVRGNRNTKDRVIRRELRFLPEELYDTTKVKSAEQSLVESRLFNDAKITPVGEQPGVRDALVTLEESDTTSILFGVGVTSNSGLVGSVSIEQRNFDIFDKPRSAKEFFRGRSFRGAGQTMRLVFEPGTELNRGRIEFREPYLFDRDIGMGLALYLFERGRDEFDEQRIGFTPSFDKRWKEGPLKGWAVEAAFRFEQIQIGDTDRFTAKEIRDDRGGNWLTTVKGSIVRDTTDSRWLPSEGDRLQLSLEQAGVMGGDHTFTKALANYDRYFTLKTDVFGRKHILQFGATAGQIFGDAPTFEVFRAGGIGSIRGFAFWGVSPRAGLRDDRVGGDFLLLTNAEYSFPLIGKTVRGATFLDMGTVERDFGVHSWRAAVGFGARIYVKYFGPIPLAFDFAFPIAEEDDDDRQIFNFSFGATF